METTFVDVVFVSTDVVVESNQEQLKAQFLCLFLNVWGLQFNKGYWIQFKSFRSICGRLMTQTQGLNLPKEFPKMFQRWPQTFLGHQFALE